jgi:REP element-mobilizing transposase RayT
MSVPKEQPPLNPDRIVDPRAQPKAIPQWRGDLPHIYKEGCTYFVTFCLVDAVPDWLKRRRRIEGAEDPKELAEHYDLDPSIGNRILRKREIASIVETAMLHFQGERYALSAWCVMPNHVHVVVMPYSDYSLSQILHSWKSFSAHEINKALQRKGTVWESESFDHLVRHERAFEQFVQYTENNPVVAGFCDSPDQWPFSSARCRLSGE